MLPLIVANSKDYELHQDDNIIAVKHPSIEEFWFAILYMFKFKHQYKGTCIMNHLTIPWLSDMLKLQLWTHLLNNWFWLIFNWLCQVQIGGNLGCSLKNILKWKKWRIFWIIWECIIFLIFCDGADQWCPIPRGKLQGSPTTN
jgi:hypothetical protein